MEANKIKMDERLKKRLVYILGATGGVGSAIVEYLNQMEDGIIQVCSLQRRVDGSSLGDKIIKFDLLNPTETDIYKWMEKQLHQYMIIEIVLVLCAGTITPLESLNKIEDCDLEKHIEVNLKGQIFLIKHLAIKADKMKIPLRIIYFDSGAAYHPIVGWGLYCTSKAYLSMYLQVLHKENPEYKIVLVDPGVVDTKMQADIRNASSTVFPEVDTFIKYKEGGELKPPKDVAKEIVEKYIYNWTAENLKEKLL